MFDNIILFLIILISLTLVLYYTKDYKEGFINFPVKHNDYVDESKKKFNELTNTINLMDPNIPVSPDSAKAFELAIGGLESVSTPNAYDLESKNTYTIPDQLPNTIKKSAGCETKEATCDAFDDETFAANCGISFDVNGIGASGKPHIGGMFISADDRKNQMTAAENVRNTGSAPYDPYKIYKPTLGKSKPGMFALNKDQCRVVKERVECESKQTFGSPNCVQCYTSQSFSRVDPKTGRLPSTLFLVGQGIVSVKSSDETSNIITLSSQRLNITTPVSVNIPANAEGTQFVISVRSFKPEEPPFIGGYLMGKTPRGDFKIDLNSLVQLDQISNAKPKINGTITVNGFKCLSLIPATGVLVMFLSCLMPFSFINVYDTDALSCDNGPIITNETSATFLESDPCFGKQNQPGNYKLECLQSRWISLGGTQKGTGYPSTQQAADAIQLDKDGNPLSINAIVDMLSAKIKQAISGLDENSKPLTINDWNTLSMWATGIPINTPCDGPNKSTGPLSKECLSYLYYNKGVASHIGGTYTLQPSEIASMKGQDIPNTYCQPGAPLDPNTPDGLQFGQKLGGINSVKQTYDQINRLANDNTKTNTERSDAVKKCYNVKIEDMNIENNVITQKTFQNNGAVSCDTYCKGVGGQPWNNELPVEWNGARCVGVGPDIRDCDSPFTYKSPATSFCVCAKTGTGWQGK